jgi:hypothetical protein
MTRELVVKGGLKLLANAVTPDLRSGESEKEDDPAQDDVHAGPEEGPKDVRNGTGGRLRHEKKFGVK